MRLEEYLRSAREKQNLNYEQISKEIKIKEEYLEAFENGEFAILPPDPFLSGFLKNYADFLGLNPEEAVDLYKHASNTLEKKSELSLDDISNVKSSFISAQQHNSIVFKVILFILIITILGFFGFKFIEDYVNTLNQKKLAAQNAIEQKIKEEAAQKIINEQIQLEAFSNMQLKIITIDKCWMKISIDDKEKFQGMINKNIEKKFDYGKKYKIILGNIYGIKMFLGNKEVDVRKNSKNGVNTIIINENNYKEWLTQEKTARMINE